MKMASAVHADRGERRAPTTVHTMPTIVAIPPASIQPSITRRVAQPPSPLASRASISARKGVATTNANISSARKIDGGVVARDGGTSSRALPESSNDSARTADREILDAHRGLADADRNALPFLAAGAHAV